MDKVKKVFRFLLNFISIAVILLAVFMLLTVLFGGGEGAPNFMGYSAFRVMTGSMEPTLPIDTLIVVKRVEPETIREGDIITFYSEDPELRGSINTHRVVKVTTEDGQTSFITRGDANLIDDKYPTREGDLIGVLVYKSVALGTLIRLVSNPLVFVPIIIIPLVCMFAVNLTRTVRVSRQMLAEEERQATLASQEPPEDPDKSDETDGPEPPDKQTE